MRLWRTTSLLLGTVLTLVGIVGCPFPAFLSIEINPNPAVVGNAVSFQIIPPVPENDILSAIWTFGDGGQASGTAVTHIYTTAGTYLVELRLVVASGSPSGTSTLVYLRSLSVTGSTRMYWVNQIMLNDNDKIQRCAIPASGDTCGPGGNPVGNLICRSGCANFFPLSNPRDVALDLAAGKLYWVEASGNESIRKANLDGSENESVVSSLSNPFGLALDLAQGKVYWTDNGTGRIHRANLDGSDVEDVVTGANDLNNGIALDLAARKIYWVDPAGGKIQRCDIPDSAAFCGPGGLAIEDFVTGLGVPIQLAINLDTRELYWSDQGTRKIQRTSLDSPGVPEDLVCDIIVIGCNENTPMRIVRGMALDLLTGKLYWTDSVIEQIKRSNLDGTSVVILFDGDILEGIALGN